MRLLIIAKSDTQTSSSRVSKLFLCLLCLHYRRE